MTRLKFKFLPDIPLPSREAIRDTIGDRKLFRTKEAITNNSDGEYVEYELLPADHATATLVSSELPDGNHMPVIDLDLPCMLVPSTMPGHYHLYINKEMSFGQMMAILREMMLAGVVQEGFHDFTAKRGAAFVRYPGVTKYNEQYRIDEAVEAIRQKLREDGILG